MTDTLILSAFQDRNFGTCLQTLISQLLCSMLGYQISPELREILTMRNVPPTTPLNQN